MHIERGGALPHVLDRPRSLVGQDGQGRALAVLLLQPAQVFWSSRLGSEEQHGRCGKGPLQIGIAALGAGRARALARRFFRALDQPAGGDTSLAPWTPLDSMKLIEQPQAQELTDPWDGTQQGEGVGVMRLGRCEDRQVEVPEPLVLVAQEGASACAPLRHGGIGKPLSHAMAVGLVGALRANLRPVVLARGMLDMGQPLGAFSHAGYPALAPVVRRTHRCGRDLGRWTHAPALAQRDCLRIHPIVCGFATLDGLHGERVPEDKGAPGPLTQGSQPLPWAQTCDRDDTIRSRGGKNLEEGLGAGRAVVLHQALPSLVQEAAGHRPGVEIDPPIRWMLLGVKSPEVSSSSW